MAIYNSRLYEQTRNQAVQLERSNRIKDEFLGVMSHELRTPLNVIMNYAEAMKMGAFGDISSEQERGTDKILFPGGTSAQPYQRHFGDHEDRKRLGHFAQGTVRARRIHLRNPIGLYDADGETPDDRLGISGQPSVIVSDRLKLKQIVTNLIDNAIKFTDDGSVTVSFQVLDQGRTLEVAVTDTGPGIPEDLLPFIFEKFRQIDSTTTRHFSGAGLGLYIVKVFAGLLEGSVEARSKPGEGSVFTVRVSTNLGARQR